MADEKRTHLRNRYKQVFRRILSHPSPNFSARFATVRCSVVHTTESPDGSFDAICGYLSTRGVPASAHYVVDAIPREGETYVRVARLVPETKKAWTQLSANPVAVSYELIGRAARTRPEWLGRYAAQLDTLAVLVADDVLQYGLPVAHEYPGQLGHRDLGRYGFPQTHTDPGVDFPWQTFEDRVRHHLKEGTKAKIEKKPGNPLDRPKTIPNRVPRWAWKHHNWLLTKPAQRGKEPDHPKPLPAWYWEWRKWRFALAAAHDREGVAVAPGG